jgi:predicted ribosomally synthesized peptide with SipW-like signal peptide
MSDKRFQLTRRNVLGSVAVLGAGAAGAGGTYAMMSDTEQSTNNSITAGTLNLRTAGNEAKTRVFSVSNAGTGSSGSESMRVNNVGSLDGYLNFDVGAITDHENGVVNDPEANDPDENNGPPGELSQYVTLRMGYDANNNGVLDPDEVVVQGSLDGMEHVQFNPNVPIPAGQSRRFIVEWEIDEEAGNEVQSDSVEVDFVFELLERAEGADVVLDGNTPYGQGAGFPNPWDTTGNLAHTGSGAWGTMAGSGGKHGFYFGGDFSSTDSFPAYTISDIAEISYWLYEPSPLTGNDIYLSIYTRPEGDGEDTKSWYDSRLQALPAEANQGSPNFTPGEWNKFSTRDVATNTLNFWDSGRATQFSLVSNTIDKPNPGSSGESQATLNELRNGDIDWSNYGTNAADSPYSYHDQTVKALSLQTNSTTGMNLEAYIDDIVVELTTGETLTIDLEP